MRIERPRAFPAEWRGLLGLLHASHLKINGRWRPAALALGFVAVLATFERSAGDIGTPDFIRLAQRAEQPQISIAQTVIAEPASRILLTIQVGPAEVVPKKTFVSLRGLPPTISLTEGHAIGPGSWAIPLAGLPTLKANIPAGVSGRAEIVVSLIGMDGRLLAETKTALVVGPASMMAPAATEAQRHPSSAAPLPAPAGGSAGNSQDVPRAAELSTEQKGRAEQLVTEGDKYLAQGKVAGARLFYRQAAEMGLAAGAIRLAATYDPAELSRLKVLGVTSDPAEARKWYERARELGAPEAEQRLARLTRN